MSVKILLVVSDRKCKPDWLRSGQSAHHIVLSMANEIWAGSMAPRSSYLLLCERLDRHRALGATGNYFVLSETSTKDMEPRNGETSLRYII